MIPIPAIDLKEGRCVRLFQGKMNQETVYGDDPVAMARKWVSEGAKRLHLVDLDGAVNGRPVHTEVIREIAESVPIPVEVGGGIRTLADMEVYLNAGVHTVIVGTAAFLEPQFIETATGRFPGRVAIGLDTQGDTIVVKGWQATTAEKISPWIERFNTLPIYAIIHTDVSRDGTQKGANTETLRLVLEESRHPVIASGGVGSLGDLEALKAVGREAGKDFLGVIIGRALYEGNFTLGEATACLEGPAC
ncbi:MAG: 1-(5-phosphoribosyl)-5-[(5-phosphoribosylamino)methylideneamino]imidazole-4-carboxamide isomerase [Deltaproteobacteria bacterium]|nr:MAG: 1-(5-phosphoribosyl)-5-[(5-phosphoribosylamino)methylideneamino]imidazole-4-carboxamide isomerase [Deltaproteobacteria bacterium]